MLCSGNHSAGYLSNLTCDWLSIVWAYSKQETENGPTALAFQWVLCYFYTMAHFHIYILNSMVDYIPEYMAIIMQKTSLSLIFATGYRNCYTTFNDINISGITGSNFRNGGTACLDITISCIDWDSICLTIIRLCLMRVPLFIHALIATA